MKKFALSLPKSDHVRMHFENTWLAHYPKPLCCFHDQGTEFTGNSFQSMLAVNGIKAVPTTVKNPTANSVCECMHKTVQDMLNIYLRDPPANIQQALELIDTCIASAQQAIHSSTHTALNVSPGALSFKRDMLLPIPIMADYNLICERRQTIIDENNRRANLCCNFKDYEIGDHVLILIKDLGTLKNKTKGPYTITNVHVNGTVTIARSPHISE